MNKVVSNKEKENAEKQRRIINQRYAEFNRMTLEKSLRTLRELVEKKQ